MSQYTDGSVRKTFLITEQQNNRLKSFCQFNKITASQLFRLFIDDLHMNSYDTTRTCIESSSIKTQNFVGAFDGEKPYQSNRDGNGHKQSRWFKKSWFNSNLF